MAGFRRDKRALHDLIAGTLRRAPPVTLPLPLRNRLAELVLEAFHNHAARRELGLVLPPTAPERRTPRELAERAERARRLFAGRPLDPAGAPLEMALGQAALLFDGRLYFEVHELLEPYWLRAAGRERETLQGLIQVAVGFHHLSNGNGRGRAPFCTMERPSCSLARSEGLPSTRSRGRWSRHWTT